VADAQSAGPTGRFTMPIRALRWSDPGVHDAPIRAFTIGRTRKHHRRAATRVLRVKDSQPN
jgi:hypothetical protein